MRSRGTGAARLVLWWLRPGADAFWLWAVLGGVLLLRTLLFMGAVALRGPGGYWFRFWVDPGVREIYVTLAVAAFLYSLAAVMIGLAAAYGLRLRQGVGAVVLGVGGAVLGLGALLALPRLERAMTTINDQMAIVPLGFSRILGLTVHLGIPTALPMWLLTAGGILGMLGVLAAAGRRRQPGVEVGGAELDGR